MYQKQEIRRHRYREVQYSTMESSSLQYLRWRFLTLYCRTPAHCRCIAIQRILGKLAQIESWTQTIDLDVTLLTETVLIGSFSIQRCYRHHICCQSMPNGLLGYSPTFILASYFVLSRLIVISLFDLALSSHVYCLCCAGGFLMLNVPIGPWPICQSPLCHMHVTFRVFSYHSNLAWCHNFSHLTLTAGKSAYTVATLALFRCESCESANDV